MSDICDKMERQRALQSDPGGGGVEAAGARGEEGSPSPRTFQGRRRMTNRSFFTKRSSTLTSFPSAALNALSVR